MPFLWFPWTGMIWTECKEVWTDGPREYIMHLWNVLDFGMLSVFVASFTARLMAFLRASNAQLYVDLHVTNADLINASLPADVAYFTYGMSQKKKGVYSIHKNLTNCNIPVQDHKSSFCSQWNTKKKLCRLSCSCLKWNIMLPSSGNTKKCFLSLSQEQVASLWSSAHLWRVVLHRRGAQFLSYRLRSASQRELRTLTNIPWAHC